MPSYTFEHIQTGELVEMVCSMADREDFLAKNPEYRQILIQAVGFIPGVNQKPDDGFRDILRNIKANSGVNNTINTW